MRSSAVVILPLGVITIGVDPVLQIGPFSIHWYGVMYAVAFTAGYLLAVRPYLERHGVTRERSERLLLWVIVAGLLGARLYYVVQNSPGYYLHHPQHILAVWEGGMAFFGAIIAALGTLAVLARREGLSFWLLWDAAVLFAVIGQPIGRIGNVINGDILGDPSSLPWATQYTNPHAVLQPGFQLDTAYQPAAAYEALATILIGLLLYALLRRGVRVGVVGIAYLALYAVSQLVVFHWRASEPLISYAGIALKQAQWTSIGLLVIGVPLLVGLWRRSGEQEPALPPPTPEPEPAPAAEATTSDVMT